MKHDTVVAKYLSRYAEQEARSVEPGGGVWDHVLCVPACREADSLMHTLDSIAAARGSESALVIVVVNGREHASAAVHESNRQTLAALQRSGGVGSEPMAWGQLNGVGLLVIDRATKGRWLPPKQGVGLARKIAGDVALSLICRGVVRSRWIRCTDADVQVPVDFFERLSGLPKRTSAVIFPFEHTQEGCARQRQAMGLYDTYLQRYVDGLKAAGSPYAYHSIGSLIAVDARSYAVVRGIPKRMAAEDFYVLNKLAKVGTIHSLDGAPIRIRGRLSDRVPFGTGPALAEIMGALESGSPVRAYDPRVFEGLGDWLAALGRFVEAPDAVRLRAEIAAIAPPLGPALVQTLEKLGAFEAAEQASQQVSGVQLQRRLMEWNDAFRTLKLVHGLRDLGICSSAV